MPPLVPGFVLTGVPSVSATGSQWAAVRSRDGLRCAVKILPVPDVATALGLATRHLAVYERIRSHHLTRQHAVVALDDGTLALVVDGPGGGSLAQLVGARGQLTTGETVTTVAPLFGALADLHAAGLVHGDPAPGSVRFTADGRPMLGDVGVAALMANAAVEGRRPSSTGRRGGTAPRTPQAKVAASRQADNSGAGTGGCVAPEVVGGAAPSARSDVYAMAALGWFCLTGAPPGPAATRPLLSTLQPATPPRLAEILTACLDADPARRPSAGAAAADVFDAAPAESVALTAVSDPAAEITRRIRSSAAAASGKASRVPEKRRQPRLAIWAVVLGVFAAFGAGATWFTLRQPATAQPAASLAVSRPTPNLSATADPSETATLPFLLSAVPAAIAPKNIAADVVTASGSARQAPARLLQALVDARALAYVTRSAPLLDLVYAVGAPKADVDRANIATALENGGTYLGLSFLVRDVAFLSGTADSARIRATIITPAYRTGQPDGRKILHPPETLKPCTFTLRMTPDGWRVLALSTP